MLLIGRGSPMAVRPEEACVFDIDPGEDCGKKWIYSVLQGVLCNLKGAFDGGTQHTDTQVDERQNSLLLTVGNMRRLPVRVTQGQANSQLELYGQLLYGKGVGISESSWAPCGWVNLNNFVGIMI